MSSYSTLTIGRGILSRPGIHSPDDGKRMFLSIETYNGLRISVNFHVEAIKFLLGDGFQYVLTKNFMQDVLEDYFGHQRAREGSSDSPSTQQFGYNDLTIAWQLLDNSIWTLCSVTKLSLNEKH